MRSPSSSTYVNARRCGSRAARGVHGDAARVELLARPAAELVVAERGEEVGRAVEVRELHGGDRAAAGGLLPRLERVDDLARRGHMLDPDELDPLHVPDDGERSHLTSSASEYVSWRQ